MPPPAVIPVKNHGSRPHGGYHKKDFKDFCARNLEGGVSAAGEKK